VVFESRGQALSGISASSEGRIVLADLRAQQIAEIDR
jgi:hypothetical protein